MKRWIRLGVVVAVIAAMTVTIVVLRNRPADTPSSVSTTTGSVDNPDRIQILENPRDQIAKITVARPDETIVFIPGDGDTFVPDYPYDVQFDNTKVRQIVSGAASLSTRRLIGAVDDPSEYGFADPSVTITVDLKDGSEQRVLIGAQTPAHDGFYAKRPDDPKVYTIYDTWITPFLATLDQMRIRDIQKVDFQSLDGVAVDTLSGAHIRASKLPDWDKDPELGYTTIAVTEPFGRRFQINTNWLQELSDSLDALSIGRFVDDNPANLAKYGLAPPRARFAITDKDKTLEMLIGSQAEGGRYAKYPDSPSVFILNGVEPIVNVAPYHVISPFALIINIDLVDRFVVQTPTERFVGRIERTPVEGQDDPDVTYFLDDKQINEDLFKKLYQWAIGLQYDAQIPEGGRPSSMTPIVTITYELNNGMGPLSISFVPYDANRVAGLRDGSAEFVMARVKVDRMIQAFKEALTE